MSKRRKIAISRLHLKTGECMKNQVVEVVDGHIVGYHPLEGEPAQMEWHDIEVNEDDLL